MTRTALSGTVAAAVALCVSTVSGGQPARPRNIVFVLIDDMRFDAMSFLGHPVARTPGIDSLARGGVHFRNAFVTTSLCSPSRASILTGQYAHRHGIMDNATRMDPGTPTFPGILRNAGYRTAYIGKWHMGPASDDPAPGFDHWVSFRGQGQYFDNDFNINGKHEKIAEYVTDVITRMSIDWIKANQDKPFMLCMAHKAVHDAFIPPPRYKNALDGVEIPFPDSMEYTPDNYFRKPKWVIEQRQSWHGVDDAYHKGRDRTLEQIVRDYYATLMAVDDSVVSLTKALKEMGLFDSTLIIFTSDNGFMWGEHGLIDKRCMYEESIRVPMVVSCPELYGAEGKTVDGMVLNIDIAPTILEAAGVKVPDSVQGQSFLRLPKTPDMPWRKAWLYEYFWERDFCETPSCLGIRTERYKYIQYHGIWDADELYDLQKDPKEMHNLISTSKRKQVTPDPEVGQVYEDLRKRLAEMMVNTGGRVTPSWAR